LKRRHIRHGRAAPGEIPTSTFPEEERADEKAITSFFRGSIDPKKPLETNLPRKHSSCLAMPHRPRRSFFSRGGIGRRARRRSGGFSASSVACRGERVDAPRGARGAADRVKKDISPAKRARGEHVRQSFPPPSRFMSPPKKTAPPATPPLSPTASRRRPTSIEISVKACKRKFRQPRYRKTCSCQNTPRIAIAPPAPRQVPRGKFGISVWVTVLIDKFDAPPPVFLLDIFHCLFDNGGSFFMF